MVESIRRDLSSFKSKTPKGSTLVWQRTRNTVHFHQSLYEICLKLGSITEEGNSPKKLNSGASLVAQCLKKKFTCQFRRLGFHPRSRKDPTCLGMNKPERHNYWICSLVLWSQNYWSPHTLEPRLHNKRLAALATVREKPEHQQRPSTAKNK